MTRKTVALARVAEQIANTRLECGKQQTQQRDSALAELRSARPLGMKEKRRRFRCSAYWNGQSHGIEDFIRREKVLMNLTFPELSELRSVKSPAIPNLEAELIATD